MKMRNPFPEHRLQDPQRQAELAVYRALEASDAPGAALYEPRFRPYTRGLDFAVWLEGIGRFGIEVKGGHYTVDGTTWWLSTPYGQTEQECPTLQVWDGAMAFRDRIARKRGKGPFIVAVLVFPDMEPDAGVRAALADGAAHAVFGVEGLTRQLAGLTQVHQPPDTADIERETALVRGAEPESEAPGPDCQSQEPARGPGLPAELGLDARQVIIQHVEHLHIHTQLPAPPAEAVQGTAELLARMDAAPGGAETAGISPE